MFSSMGDVADEMVSHLQDMLGEKDSSVVDMKKVFQVRLVRMLQTVCESLENGGGEMLFQGLSLDSISNCAFGITTNSFKNPENELFQASSSTSLV